MLYMNISEPEAEVILVQTLINQFEGSTNQDVERAKLSREL